MYIFISKKQVWILGKRGSNRIRIEDAVWMEVGSPIESVLKMVVDIEMVCMQLEKETYESVSCL